MVTLPEVLGYGGSWWNVAWVVWALAFGVLETLTLRHDRANPSGQGTTLSDNLRRWFFVNTHIGRTAWLAGSTVFAVWFFYTHIPQWT